MDRGSDLKLGTTTCNWNAQDPLCVGTAGKRLVSWAGLLQITQCKLDNLRKLGEASIRGFLGHPLRREVQHVGEFRTT
jgi:hypothetical protein